MLGMHILRVSCIFMWPHIQGSSTRYISLGPHVPTKRLFGPKNPNNRKIKYIHVHTCVATCIHLFLAPRSLPESDGHRERGGIGGAKNKFLFLIVFQR